MDYANSIKIVCGRLADLFLQLQLIKALKYTKYSCSF